MIPSDLTRRVQEQNPQVAIELLTAAQGAYSALLEIPHSDAFRIKHQRIYAALRDAIALAWLRTEEEIQNEFEAAAAMRQHRRAHTHYHHELALDAAARTGEDVLREHQP
jgi:hypothetical protein